MFIVTLKGILMLWIDDFVYNGLCVTWIPMQKMMIFKKEGV